MRLPRTLSLRKSLLLNLAVGGVHLAAAVAVAVVALPLEASLAIWSMLFLSLVLIGGRRGPESLHLLADGRVELRFADGTAVTAGVRRTTTVFPWLVVLVVRSGSRDIALALLVDALGADGHRHLRLWLKWKAIDGAV